MSLADPNMSQRLRDAVRRIAENVVKEQGVTYRYGTVQTIDYAGQRVTVLFPGSATPVPVKTLGVQPTANGQVVQVSSVSGDHFVTGVVGAASVVGADPNSIEAPTLTLDGLSGQVLASWNKVDNAASYEIEFAYDSQFTQNAQTFQIAATQFTFIESDTQQDIFARVRALTWHDPPQAGAWSAVAGAVRVLSLEVSSDGNVPVDSPDVVVTPGLGFLQAKWSAQDNLDPVTYEVHIAQTSGFQPSSATLYDETRGLTMFIKTLADGTPLQYDTDYYVRILAKDRDGPAPNPGAQDIEQIQRVNTGDAGNIGIGNVSDGNVPSTSPAVRSVTGGIGYLYVRWDQIVNPDPVTYEVHMSTTSGFAPNFNTKIGQTPSSFYIIREQGPGASRAPLQHATTYYIKIIAFDADGYAPAYGAQGSGAIVKAQTADFAVGSITAGSGVIANAAIGEAQIQNLSVTQGKVANLAVSTAKIQDLAVTDAKIATLDVGKLTAGSLTADIIVGTGEIAALGTIGEVVLDGDGIRSWANTTRTGTPSFQLLTNSNFGKPKLTFTYDTGKTISIGHNVTHSGFGEVVAGINFNDGDYSSENYWYVYTTDGAGSPRTRFRVGGATNYITFDTDTGVLEVVGGGTFSGNLSAAGGTFSGDLSAAGGTFTGNLTAAGGTFSGDISGANGTFTGDLSGSTITGASMISSTLNVEGSAGGQTWDFDVNGAGLLTLQHNNNVAAYLYGTYNAVTPTDASGRGLRVTSQNVGVSRDTNNYPSGGSYLTLTDDRMNVGNGANNFLEIDAAGAVLACGTGDNISLIAHGEQIDVGPGGDLIFWTNNTERMRVDNGGAITMTTPNATTITLNADAGQQQIVVGTTALRFDVAGAIHSYFRASGDDKRINLGGESNDYIEYNPITERFAVGIGDADQLIITTTGTLSQNVDDRIFGTDPSVHVSTVGELHRNSSSLRWKSDVQERRDITTRGMRPISYRNTRKGNNGEREHSVEFFGLGAEDVVAALGANAGFYDEDGNVEDYQDRAVLAALVSDLHDVMDRLDAAGL